MTANVVFYTEERTNVLMVPLRVVRTNADGTKYVRVLENGQIKETTVKTGLRGDGGLVEILEGLQEGQEVIVTTQL
jgi:multidrug efflux pump subunit AcrA (membrane-fusion protein)